MVERSRRGKGKRKLMGNHQRCWIWGRNLVLETLRAGRWCPVDVWLSEDLPHDPAQEAEGLAAALGTPVQKVDPAVLRQRCSTSEHQGFAARMPEFPYATESDLRSFIEQSEPAVVVLCDRLQDPWNLGAILRSAEALGGAAVVLGPDEQVGVTSLVARASAGAVNHVPIVRTDSLATTARELQTAGIPVAACSEKAAQPVHDCDFTGPVALIVGNEGLGISNELLHLATHQVAIPLSGAVASLNVAAAAAIVLYEIQRQRTT